MPSVSEKQKKFMMLALAYKKGDIKDVSTKVKKVADSMTREQLEHYKIVRPEDDNA